MHRYYSKQSREGIETLRTIFRMAHKTIINLKEVVMTL